MPKKNDRPTPRSFHVADHIRVSLPGGKIVDATIKAVIETTEGIKLQVDFEHDQTALVHVRQVVVD
jgi:hypothetical protein